MWNLKSAFIPLSLGFILCASLSAFAATNPPPDPAKCAKGLCDYCPRPPDPITCACEFKVCETNSNNTLTNPKETLKSCNGRLGGLLEGCKGELVKCLAK